MAPSAPSGLQAKRVTIGKSTGHSPYCMVHGVHPLLPFDIAQATYLSPPQDFGLSTEELVAFRAHEPAKRPEDLEKMRGQVVQTRCEHLRRFEKRLASHIVDFDFQPGELVLVRNTRVEGALDRKTKHRYIGPMVIVRKTPGTSYVVAELGEALSQLRVAGFRVIPYFRWTRSSIPIVPDVSDHDDDTTEDDPEDVLYFTSLDPDAQEYAYYDRLL